MVRSPRLVRCAPEPACAGRSPQLPLGGSDTRSFLGFSSSCWWILRIPPFRRSSRPGTRRYFAADPATPRIDRYPPAAARFFLHPRCKRPQQMLHALALLLTKKEEDHLARLRPQPLTLMVHGVCF